MSIESKGPGNVGNSYGTRGTNTPRQFDTAGVLKPDYQEYVTQAERDAIQALVSGYGIPHDGAAFYDATSTNSTTSTIGSATAVAAGGFTAADIGKVCVLIPYTDNPASKYGTITAVAADRSTCTVSLNSAPGALSGATFVYGTDAGAALDAALAAVDSGATKGTLVLPLGIICSTRAHINPTGAYTRGANNNPCGGKAKDFRHWGTSLVLCSFQAGGAFWTNGNVPSDTKGTRLEYLNVDCAGLCTRSIIGVSSGRTEHMRAVTAVRGTGETYSSSPTARVTQCSFIGANASNVVSLTGDSTFTDNIVTGAGNGFYGIKCSNGDDILIAHNHIWKDSAATSMLGGSIWLSHNSGSVTSGSVTVMGNKCDTNYGSAIKVSISGASSARAISIIGNHCFNNDAVVNNTGPVIELNVAASCDIRGLTIQGNTARASWNDPTKGQWSYLIDNSASVGTIYGSHVGGNVGQGVNALYNTFTPTMDGGNLVILANGTTVTKSTIA